MALLTRLCLQLTRPKVFGTTLGRRLLLWAVVGERLDLLDKRERPPLEVLLDSWASFRKAKCPIKAEWLEAGCR